MIGAGGKGAEDIAHCESENIVALADPDPARISDSVPSKSKRATLARSADKASRICWINRFGIVV
ncbi:MAG: hypothetical protein ABSC08_16960 [Bryobacteraceae bacterium]